MGLFDRLLGKDAGSNHERSCPIGFDVTDDSRVTSAATIVVMNRRLLPSLAPEDLSLIVRHQMIVRSAPRDVAMI
jgi:hypothetical protein